MPKTVLPRGIRNNNPFNIRISSNKWQGKDEPSKDGAFETFNTPVMGIRAGVKNCLAKQANGHTTVRELISVLSPPNENSTEAYIKHVADFLIVLPDDPIDLDDFAIMKKLTKAIIAEENGPEYRNYYKDDVLDQALQLAGVHNVPPRALVKTPEAQAVIGTASIATLTAVSTLATPTIPLIQSLITAAPWLATAIGIGVIVFLVISLVKKYKTTGGI